MIPLTPPDHLRVRLSVVEALTGTPERTMREAIARGELQAVRFGRAWYTTLGHHNEWIEANEGGGDAAAAPKRAVEVADQTGRPGDRRPGQTHEGSGAPSAARKAGGKRRRKPVLYDLRARLAE